MEWEIKHSDIKVLKGIMEQGGLNWQRDGRTE